MWDALYLSPADALNRRSPDPSIWFTTYFLVLSKGGQSGPKGFTQLLSAVKGIAPHKPPKSRHRDVPQKQNLLSYLHKAAQSFDG